MPATKYYLVTETREVEVSASTAVEAVNLANVKFKENSSDIKITSIEAREN